jgi:hypothetical protein
MLSRELRRQMDVSEATFARGVAELGSRLLGDGSTRARTLAARRAIVGLPGSIPIYDLRPSGVAQFGVLHPVAPAGFFLEAESSLRGFYPDLPWFFHETRPAGFLGRLAPRQHPELGLPPDIEIWSADHVLRWLHEWGVDTVGSLVVGERAFRRIAGHGGAAVERSQREDRYPELAEQAMALGVPGSSAAGEQPKFLATRAGGGDACGVLVKFSPPLRDAATRRTADLLRCEHLALRSLREAGIPAAESEVVEAGGRVFLEVERFDRFGDGRLGVVSLSALAAHHGAGLESWTAAADDLLAARVLSAEDHRRMVWLDRFGELIGNSDRHAGNLSFFFDSGKLGGLAPAYDMLPMAYAVRSGEFATRPIDPLPPSPRLPSVWRGVWPAAKRFWEAVAREEAIDPALRGAATANAESLGRRAVWLDRLPPEPKLPLFHG